MDELRLEERLLRPHHDARAPSSSDSDSDLDSSVMDESPTQAAPASNETTSSTLPPVYARIRTLAAESLAENPPRYIHVRDNAVTVTNSDGNTTRWPFAEVERVSPEGMVDYLTFAEPKSEAGWMQKIGRALVEVAGLSEPDKKQRYTLSHFPSGYVLYARKKGQKDSPRKDYYLYGASDVIVFRSPYEFVMHALWLTQGRPVDDVGESLCLCKYCGPVKSQSVISSLWTGKFKTTKSRPRGADRAPRHIVQREHEGIGGAVWTEVEGA